MPGEFLARRRSATWRNRSGGRFAFRKARRVLGIAGCASWYAEAGQWVYPCAMTRTILIAGASGLVGSEFLGKALDDVRVDRVVALVRRSTGLKHPKLVEWTSGEGDLLTGLREERVDAVVCALGTTIRTVGGDRQKFIHVDRDLVLGLGQWAKRLSVPVFSVVSAIGADPRSRVFYSRVKGEMEAGLRAIAISRTVILQPSIITGPRKEVRSGERVGIAMMTALAPLMWGGLSIYRPMRSDLLAAALLESSLSERLPSGVHVLRYHAIRALAGGRSPATSSSNP